MPVYNTSKISLRKLSNLELLLVAFAVLALAYLGSLGPKPDPWLETAKAELQTPALTCSTCSSTQAYDQVDQSFVAPPDSAAPIRAIAGSALDSEVVEPNAPITPNADKPPKTTEEIADKSLSKIATAKVDEETKSSLPNMAAARPVKSPAGEIEGRETGSSLQNPRLQRRARPSAMSVRERLSSSRYHRIPRGTEKMFDQNWQSRAFLYQ